MRPEKKTTKLAATGGGTVVDRSKWKSAADAIVAAARLRKEEHTVYRPSDERRVTVAADTKLSAKARDDKVRSQLANEVQQRQLARSGQKANEACRIADINTLARLVQAEPAIANWADENNVTPLMMACAYGRKGCTEVLCGAGADVNRTNVWGSTPLINAAHNAHASVVHFLILHEANVSVRDKDGTALDGALRRLCKMVRGVAAATDDKHPDKPGLEAAHSALFALVQQNTRGPVWHKQLEAAFVPFRTLLAQSEEAAETLSLGKVEPFGAGAAAPKKEEKEEERPGSAASKGSKGSKGSKSGDKKKKADDEPEPPDEGRVALYVGLVRHRPSNRPGRAVCSTRPAVCWSPARCLVDPPDGLRLAVRWSRLMVSGSLPGLEQANYVRIMEMLRDPALVRKHERMRVGGVDDKGDEKKADGLTQKVGRVRAALALDVALSLPEVIKQANVAMGFEDAGTLPDQTQRLVTALGLQ